MCTFLFSGFQFQSSVLQVSTYSVFIFTKWYNYTILVIKTASSISIYLTHSCTMLFHTKSLSSVEKNKTFLYSMILSRLISSSVLAICKFKFTFLKVKTWQTFSMVRPFLGFLDKPLKITKIENEKPDRLFQLRSKNTPRTQPWTPLLFLHSPRSSKLY